MFVVFFLVIGIRWVDSVTSLTVHKGTKVWTFESYQRSPYAALPCINYSKENATQQEYLNHKPPALYMRPAYTTLESSDEVCTMVGSTVLLFLDQLLVAAHVFLD